MRSLVLSALILASAFQTALGQIIVDGQWTYIVQDGEATITASTATGAVTIPSALGGYAVKKVGNSWPPIFGSSNTSVTSVVIPNSVTSIGESAFQMCSSLTSVTIPNSVTSIGSQAFQNCTSLASVTIPNSVTSIGYDAFYGCTGLTTITIPNSVRSIGSQSFQYCSNLVTVYLPARFETTYQDFGLTSSQVYFYDSSSTSYLAGQQSVINNPSAHNLYTATQHTANFNAGKDSVLNSPNSNGLYTTSQIQNMAVGDLVLNRQVDGSFVLNYDIEQSTDLQNWTPYQALSLPMTNLPTDKAFVRIKAKQ